MTEEITRRKLFKDMAEEEIMRLINETRLKMDLKPLPLETTGPVLTIGCLKVRYTMTYLGRKLTVGGKVVDGTMCFKLMPDEDMEQPLPEWYVNISEDMTRVEILEKL